MKMRKQPGMCCFVTGTCLIFLDVEPQVLVCDFFSEGK